MPNLVNPHPSVKKVREAALRVAKAEVALHRAQLTRDETIRSAYRAGARVQDLLDVAGVSRPRVYQILHMRPEGVKL